MAGVKLEGHPGRTLPADFAARLAVVADAMGPEDAKPLRAVLADIVKGTIPNDELNDAYDKLNAIREHDDPERISDTDLEHLPQAVKDEAARLESDVQSVYIPTRLEKLGFVLSAATRWVLAEIRAAQEWANTNP